MKRKFILLPITLTALTPMISMVGCGDPDTPEPPEPKYEDIEFSYNAGTPIGEYLSDDLVWEKNKKYHLWISDVKQDILDYFDHKIYISFWNDDTEGWDEPNVVIDNFLIGGETKEYVVGGNHVLRANMATTDDIDLYLTFNQNYSGYFSVQ